MRVVSILLLLSGGLTFGPQASAEPKAESNFQTRSTALYFQMGLGTPLGWAGGEVEQTLTSFLAISGGVGMGFAGPQVALMPRLRLGGKLWAVTLGTGVSYGRFHWDDRCLLHCRRQTREGTVTWGNFEPGFEIRLPNGFSARAFLGYGRIVAGEFACIEPGESGCGADDGRSLVYLGVASGWAF